MNKLYIIGNGFDLKHGLPSRYNDFAKFCEATDRELFEQVEILFPKITGNSLWSNFEAGLGYVNTNMLHEFFYTAYQADRRNDMFLDMHNRLKLCFRDWVRLLTKQTEKLQRCYTFDNSDCFISFNYTDTLESAYNIMNIKILHIHGYAQFHEKEVYAGYIFGHGQPEQVPHDPIDSFEYLSKDFSNGFRKEFKVEDLIERIKFWNSKGFHFNHIVVLGHSLSEIDEIYFKEILKLIPNASWTIDYFDELDYTHKQERIRKMNIPGNSVKFIKS